MESPFPCSQVLLFDEGKLNTKVPEEDLLPIKEIIKSIREMKIDVVEVLYLIRINIKLQEQNNQKITDITGKADAHLKELELHKSKTEADLKAQLEQLIKAFTDYKTGVSNDKRTEDLKELQMLLELYKRLKALQVKLDKDKDKPDMEMKEMQDLGKYLYLKLKVFEKNTYIHSFIHKLNVPVNYI